MIQIELDSFCLLKLAHFFAEEKGTCLLYSGSNFDSAVFSYLFLFPYECIEIQDKIQSWEHLKSQIIISENAPNTALWVGFLSYEMGEEAVNFEKKIPDAYFQKTAFVLCLNHKTEQADIYLKLEAIKNLTDEAKSWMEKFSQKDFWKPFIQSLPEIVPETSQPLRCVKDFETLDVYTHKIEEIREMIKDGDVYQVNLSHELELIGKKNPFLVFYKLSQINPAPFSAYFKHENFTIVSSSPERLLKKSGGLLETRPIKGTMPRGKTEFEDLENKEKLLYSKKDLSELLMITDLMRNDLGKISLPGSVKTLKITHLEAYSNVYHLLSIIQSKPIPTIHPVDLLRNCFPGGSVTGCPKLSAIRVIKNLEKRTRGIYTGSIGYFSENGDFDFNIAIRTLLFQEDKIYIQLGGAITIDSDAKSEYGETMQKGESIFKSLT